MTMKIEEGNIPGKGEIILYQSPDGKAALDVRLKGDTLWLTQKQISHLFQTERTVITKHLGNIFRSGELEKDSVCAKFAHTAEDGNKRIAAALFLWFMEKNRALYDKDGKKRIADNALVAITLMIAESDPAEKETMVKLIVNLINSRN
jgi:hypothetical protein